MKPTKLLTVLAVATLPFLASCVSEAERARIAAEQAEQARIAKEAEAKRQAEEVKRQAIRLKYYEKRMISVNMETLLAKEKALSEEERSRGRALLEAFGEEQMPVLTEKCKTARRNCLEAEANLKELITALKAEDPNFNPDLEENESSRRCRGRDGETQKANPIFNAARNRWLDLAAEYWWLRYKLTDFYSQFKIGAITPDELVAKDAEFAKE